MDGVDLLRGLAICFVLMNHVNMQLLGAKVSYTQGLPRQLVCSLVWNGQFGVQIFLCDLWIFNNFDNSAALGFSVVGERA
jgi:peptidoglycan/LPS O-acetylase OafA/YrhL